MVSLTIDGKTISVPAGTTILEAARKLEIAIPTLCWLQKVSPTGACRICAVEVQGVARPMTACNTPVKEGLVVTTQSEQLSVIRRQVVELLLINHPLDCPVCDAGGECDLQNICYDLNVTGQPFVAEDVNPGPIDKWPLIQQVPNRCILCEKCVKVCHETVGSSALFVNDKGDSAFIDKKLELCEFCGNCVSVCPTGTMISKPFKFKARPWELTKTPSVCTTCASQCEIDVNVKQGKVARVTSTDGTTRNDGNLCIGGFFGFDYLNSARRLKQPLAKGGAASFPVSWDEALGAVAAKIREVGPQAVAGLSSPRLTNEENYLFQRLMRVAVGTNNIDSEARYGALRMAKELDAALGLHGSSNYLDRIGKAEAVLVFGSDVTAEAPAVDWQIEASCRRNDGKLVVANMRAVKLTRYSNSFLQYRPGSEVALANALSRLILEQGLADQSYLDQFVENQDELKESLLAVDLEQAVAQTGVSRKDLEEAARYLGVADSVALVLGGDLSKGGNAASATRALANLALVSGALHGDIGGLFPVDEKGNMQGLLDMGVCPEYLPGYQGYEAAKTKFEGAWRTKLPAGGRDASGILEGIEKGEIKALYLAGADPLVAFPESARWRQALEKVEFLVVQNILESELTALADVVLPGAAATEKTGSVTSLDNRVSCLGKALKAPGQAREDWDILADLYDRLAPKADPLDRDAVLTEVKDLSGLYGDICLTGDGRCRACVKAPFSPAPKGLTFVPAAADEAAEGMQLLSGKILFHFGTTTTVSDGCLAVAPAGYIEVNPRDAEKLGVSDGDVLKVSTGLGSAQGPVSISEAVAPGLLFAPYHFADVNIQQVMPQGQNRVAVEVTKV